MRSSNPLHKSVIKLLSIARAKESELSASLASVQIARASTETALAQVDRAVIDEHRRAEIERETNPALDVNLAVARFAESLRAKRANMATTLAQLTERERDLKAELSAANIEISKLEHLAGTYEKRDRAANAQREQAELDDQAILRHVR